MKSMISDFDCNFSWRWPPPILVGNGPALFEPPYRVCFVTYQEPADSQLSYFQVLTWAPLRLRISVKSYGQNTAKIQNNYHLASSATAVFDALSRALSAGLAARACAPVRLLKVLLSLRGIVDNITPLYPFVKCYRLLGNPWVDPHLLRSNKKPSEGRV